MRVAVRFVFVLVALVVGVAALINEQQRIDQRCREKRQCIRHDHAKIEALYTACVARAHPGAARNWQWSCEEHARKLACLESGTVHYHWRGWDRVTPIERGPCPEKDEQ